MTNQHPITPPPELVQQWMAEIWHEGTPVRVSASDLYIATQAARWGADQELEACCKWAAIVGGAEALRDARRPKPPSLRSQALAALFRLKSGALCADRVTDENTILRALEALPE